jgi:hypothetical protein
MLAALSTAALFGFLGFVMWQMWPQHAQVMADLAAALGSPATGSHAATTPTAHSYRRAPMPVVSPGDTGSASLPQSSATPTYAALALPPAPAATAAGDASPQTDAAPASIEPSNGDVPTHVPFLAAWSAAGGPAFGGDGMPGAQPGSFNAPMWLGGGAPGAAGGGATGGSALAPLGGGARERSFPAATSLALGDDGSTGGGPGGGGSSSETESEDGGDPRGSGGDPTHGGFDGVEPGGSGPTGSGVPGDDGSGDGGWPGLGPGDGDGGDGDGVAPGPDDNPFPTTGTVIPPTTTGGVTDDTSGGDERTIPEPASLVLLGIGACGVASRALRRR